MLFNSYIFILFFFPVLIAGYYILRRYQEGMPAKIWLIGMSLWFYAYFNVYYLPILVGSILVNYGLYLLLQRGSLRKTLYVTGLVLNIGVLFYYKYFDFFLENLNVLFREDFVLRGIVLPLGISFFTFQQIGFLTDAYRGEIKDCSPVDYALFVSFFPQLIAGPIVSADEMLPQFKRLDKLRFDGEKCAKGLYLFALGLGKKVLLADVFALAVNWGYEYYTYLDSSTLICISLFYTVQLYFDFSGYCDMARGLGHMLMIELPVNFDSPYRASNLVEFWKRWHITLSRFLTKYLYFPLGGNRKGRARQYFNIFLVFLVSGVWHGAGWNFVVWGLLHGLGQIMVRLVKPYTDKLWKNRGRILQKIIKIAGTMVTFAYVNFAWIFFRAETLGRAVDILRIIFGESFGKPNRNALHDMASFFNTKEMWFAVRMVNLDRTGLGQWIVMLVFAVAAAVLLWVLPNAGKLEEKWKPTWWSGAIVAVIMLWSLVSLSGVSTFLYFNF